MRCVYCQGKMEKRTAPLISESHLHWPDLDVDLELDSLSDLERYPLVYQ